MRTEIAKRITIRNEKSLDEHWIITIAQFAIRLKQNRATYVKT